MTFERLPETVSTLYAELLERALVLEASAGGTPFAGSFVSKEIRGRKYWYLQRLEGDRKRQAYLGPDSPRVREVVERMKRTREELAPDAADVRRLAAMLGSGRAWRETAGILAVLRLLADAGVFRRGGLLVGTVAFGVYGNVLGVRFDQQAVRTQDLDVVYEPSLVLVLDEGEKTNVGKPLEESGLGFVPIPELDHRNPSTSFKIRGKELRVDFLTPLRGPDSERPIYLPAYGVAAQPLRFLDYLVEALIPAVVVGGDGVLVQVPDPSRFAFYKLWTAAQRPAFNQVKAVKDLRQAAQLLTVLVEDRPGDLGVAWEALSGRARLAKTVRRMAARLEPELRARVVEIVPGLAAVS